MTRKQTTERGRSPSQKGKQARMHPFYFAAAAPCPSTRRTSTPRGDKNSEKKHLLFPGGS